MLLDILELAVLAAVFRAFPDPKHAIGVANQAWKASKRRTRPLVPVTGLAVYDNAVERAQQTPSTIRAGGQLD